MGWFHLYEVPRRVKFREMERELWYQGPLIQKQRISSPCPWETLSRDGNKNTGKSKQPTKPHKCSGVPRQHRAEGTMKAKMGHLTWNYIIFDLPCLLAVQLAISPCAYPQHSRDVMGYRTRISISTLKRDSYPGIGAKHPCYEAF